VNRLQSNSEEQTVTSGDIFVTLPHFSSKIMSLRKLCCIFHLWVLQIIENCFWVRFDLCQWFRYFQTKLEISSCIRPRLGPTLTIAANWLEVTCKWNSYYVTVLWGKIPKDVVWLFFTSELFAYSERHNVIICSLCPHWQRLWVSGHLVLTVINFNSLLLVPSRRYDSLCWSS
jgi:hypothetical protein